MGKATLFTLTVMAGFLASYALTDYLVTKQKPPAVVEPIDCELGLSPNDIILQLLADNIKLKNDNRRLQTILIEVGQALQQRGIDPRTLLQPTPAGPKIEPEKVT